MGMNIAIAILVPVLLTFCGNAFAQSEEARRHFDRGMAAVELAKSSEDLNVAINEFKQATILAPDWPDAHFNLGKVLEATERFKEAIVSYRRYLELAPNATDAAEVKSSINKLEFKAENVLTVEKVASILGGMSTWPARAGSGFHKYFRHKGQMSIEVPSSVLWKQGRPEPDVFLRTLEVKSPKVGFKYTNVVMDNKNVANISTDYEIEIEVVSTTRVKVKSVSIWHYWASGGDPVKRVEVFDLVPNAN